MARGKLKIYSETNYVSGRIRRFVKVWAKMLINNNIDYKKACNVYKRNEKIPEATVKRLLKRKVVQDMLVEEIEALFEKEGVTPEFVIKNQKKVLDMSLDKKDLSNANRVLESFRDSLNMNPSKRITISETHGIESNISLDSIAQKINQGLTESEEARKGRKLNINKDN